MAKGDHLYYSILFEGNPITHHGIDCGDDAVIHYDTQIKGGTGKIVRISRQQFGKGRNVQVREYGKCVLPDVVVQRAILRLSSSDKANYNLFSNNCEHFAFWCKTDRHESEQVRNAQAGASGVAGGGAAVAAGIGVVSGVGAAAGLSGAGIMSGLATVGSVVGGGAVAGVGVLGAAPGLISKLAMEQVLKDDEALPDEEREARAAGRTMTTVGMAAGTAGSVGAIAAAGSVTGLSAAGITSGLAAIGGTVGGGMAAGVAITVAAPAVAAAAVGYGAYQVWKWLSE